MQSTSRSMERLVIAWQVTLTAVVVAAGVSVLASVLSMPRTGYKCDLCDTLTCQSFLGWDCGAAANRDGFCEIRVFPDSSAVLVCPSQEEVQIASLSGAFDTIDVDAECDARCGGAMPSAQPPDSSPSDGGATDGDGDSGGGSGAPPGTDQPVGGQLDPGGVSDGGDGDVGGAPGGGGAQFIDPTVGTSPGGDDVGATSR